MDLSRNATVEIGELRHARALRASRAIAHFRRAPSAAVGAKSAFASLLADRVRSIYEATWPRAATGKREKKKTMVANHKWFYEKIAEGRRTLLIRRRGRRG